MIRFTTDRITVTAAEGDTTGERRIDAIAVPYNQYATVSDGTEVQFLPGSLPIDGKAPRVFMYHDASKPVGIVTERIDTPEGMLASMKISRTDLGDEALVLAADGVMDVSVGVNIISATRDKDGRMTVTAADWLELSLVPIPAFSGATITDVAASAETDPDTNPETTEPVEETTEVEATPAPAEAIEAAAIPTPSLPAQAKRKFALPSAADWMASYHIGGDTFAKVNAAVAEWQSENQTALQAAAGDVATTNTPGLLPVPVLGPLVQNINFVRPVVNRLGARAYPDGGQQKTFVRPTITTHTSAAAQSAEFDAVSATTMVIASNTISKTTVAGQVSLSRQDVDFTSPGAMELILNDLVGELMLKTDDIAADALLAGASSSGVWDLTTTDLMKSIYDAAVDVSRGTNFFPDTIFVSPDVWGQMGQLVDGSNRPVFPYLGSPGLAGQNALGGGNATTWTGSNPLGLEIVVDSNFAAKTMIITNASKAFEYYEDMRGIMSVDQPATLSRLFSVHAYCSTFVAVSSMIRKITQA